MYINTNNPSIINSGGFPSRIHRHNQPSPLHRIAEHSGPGAPTAIRRLLPLPPFLAAELPLEQLEVAGAREQARLGPEPRVVALVGQDAQAALDPVEEHRHHLAVDGALEPRVRRVERPQPPVDVREDRLVDRDHLRVAAH